MIAGVNTEITRANWATVPGRQVQLTVNASGQYTKEVYIDENGNTVFAVNYTYDANGKVINISCTNS